MFGINYCSYYFPVLNLATNMLWGLEHIINSELNIDNLEECHIKYATKPSFFKIMEIESKPPLLLKMTL